MVKGLLEATPDVKVSFNQILYFKREKDNKADKNAIAVFTLQHQQVGHVFGKQAAQMAPRMKSNEKVLCKLITGVTNTRHRCSAVITY